MKKRLLAALLVLVLTAGLCPTIAGAIDISHPSVFVKQQTRSTCTLASVTMLLRRKALVDADANWWTITESDVRRVAWSGGLAWNFTYNGVNISVKRKASGWAGSSLDTKRQALIDMLAAHPEGVVAYSTSQPHAVLLTDYDYNTGIFYCCDPAPYYPNGRVELTRSSLRGGSQDGILQTISQLWYVSGGVSNGAGTDPWPALIEAIQSPAQAEEPQAEAVPMARNATQSVSVDSQKSPLEMYALTDGQGNDVNYVKLRDLAQALNGTKAQFDVGYNGAVTLTTGIAYSAAHTDVETPFQDDQPYTVPTAATLVDGKALELDAIQLTDEQGGGHIYYNLRELGDILGYQVNWDPSAGIHIDIL